MPILGVDLSSNQRVFDFARAHVEGCRTAYIKLGGDNIAQYVSSTFAPRVDLGHAVGWPIGSYWITGGHDPVQAAGFFVSNLHAFGPTDYIVLDNEKLDNGNVYSDVEAAAWVSTVVALTGVPAWRVLHYGSKSFMESHGWPSLLATGCSFLIADYNDTPLVNHIPAGIPADRVVGHQYADNGAVGGASPVDVNAFTDAFFSHLTNGTDPNNMFDPAAQQFLLDLAADIKSSVRREGRGRLFYCATPPAGLPQFVIIFENRDPGAHNVIYCNDGAVQADHLNGLYGQTADTITQAMKMPDSPAQFATRIALALGTDSAFINNLAAVHADLNQ